MLVKLELQQGITSYLESEDTVKEATKLIVEHVELLPELPTKVQYGHTKVFLKAGMLARMEEIRTDIINKAATSLQRSIRRFNAQSVFEQERRAALLAQRRTISMTVTLPLNIPFTFTLTFPLPPLTHPGPSLTLTHPNAVWLSVANEEGSALG